MIDVAEYLPMMWQGNMGHIFPVCMKIVVNLK
jgi:hypothetical protein